MASISNDERVSSKKVEKHSPPSPGKWLRFAPTSKKSLTPMTPETLEPFCLYDQSDEQLTSAVPSPFVSPIT